MAKAPGVSFLLQAASPAGSFYASASCPQSGKEFRLTAVAAAWPAADLPTTFAVAYIAGAAPSNFTAKIKSSFCAFEISVSTAIYNR
jgi:hypothetical protein